MTRTPVLVLLDPLDPSAEPFRQAIGRDSYLADAIELRFASAQNAAAAISDCEVVACGVLPPDLVDAASHLRWMAFWSAGLDGKLTPQIMNRGLLLTNASGVHGPNIAEHVMAYMLMFTRRMEMHMRYQIRHLWDRKMPADRPASAELTGQTLGIVGFGRIGEALTVRARGFGMRIIAIKRDPTTRYTRSNASEPDEIYDISALPYLLSQSDHVCIALPHTPETHHLFNGPMLAHMKPTAYLYNIARGAIVDESALVSALQQGALAGAGLDVFEQEPLPDTSPLWTLENVIITPHVSGLTPHYFARFADLFAGNLRRYLQGVELNNLYRDERGY